MHELLNVLEDSAQSVHTIIPAIGFIKLGIIFTVMPQKFQLLQALSYLLLGR